MFCTLPTKHMWRNQKKECSYQKTKGCTCYLLYVLVRS